MIVLGFIGLALFWGAFAGVMWALCKAAADDPDEPRPCEAQRPAQCAFDVLDPHPMRQVAALGETREERSA